MEVNALNDYFSTMIRMSHKIGILSEKIEFCTIASAVKF